MMRSFLQLSPSHASSLAALALAAAVVGSNDQPGSPEADDGLPGGSSLTDGTEGMFTAADAPPPFSPSQLAFFESKVRPLLAAACSGCHSERGSRIRGGLVMDDRPSLLLGGDSGPAIVPGDPEASLLITAVRYHDPDFQMPPRDPLPTEDVAILEQWVRMGAPMPPRRTIGLAPGTEGRWTDADIERGRLHWAYRPVSPPPTPSVDDSSWPWADLDRFVLANLEQRGLVPVEDAAPHAWLRRVTFDLTGLPPTLLEIDDFLADESPEAEARVVDRLLATPAFGERWGRHWLDVARYAESSGRESNLAYPHAWRYRAWVISAFNRDVPYDRFVEMQIAGDLLPESDPRERARNLIATGYLAVGLKEHSGNTNQLKLDLVDEQLDAIGQGILATTISCARCHDHKFDPIPQRDYYALAGILGSTRTHFGIVTGRGSDLSSDAIALPTVLPDFSEPEIPHIARMALIRARHQAETRIKAGMQAQTSLGERDRGAMEMMDSSADELRRIIDQGNGARETAGLLDSILSRFDERGSSTDRNAVCMGVSDASADDAPFLERGEWSGRGELVPRGFLRVLDDTWTPEISSGSGRLELARWITDERHPLTARVWANRIWGHLFGRGLVSTPDNFGISGRPPSNPPLLDHLATRLRASNWSTKSFIRELVLSRTYRLGTQSHPANEAIDPDNVHFWRMPRRRLEAESIRDAMLSVSGLLAADPPAGSPSAFIEGRALEPIAQQVMAAAMPAFQDQRSIYLPIIRTRIPESLAIFDFPEPDFVTGDRDETNVAPQALYLMNSEESRRLSMSFAKRVLAGGGSFQPRVERAFMYAFGRPPTRPEYRACRSFLNDFAKAWEQDQYEEMRSESPKQRDQRLANQGIQEQQTGFGTAALRPPDLELESWTGLCQMLFQSAEFRTVR